MGEIFLIEFNFLSKLATRWYPSSISGVRINILCIFTRVPRIQASFRRPVGVDYAMIRQLAVHVHASICANDPCSSDSFQVLGEWIKPGSPRTQFFSRQGLICRIRQINVQSHWFLPAKLIPAVSAALEGRRSVIHWWADRFWV
jgi:hypothetical protein